MAWAQGALISSGRGLVTTRHRLHLQVPSPSTKKAGVPRRAPWGSSRLRGQRVENSHRKARADSRQALPCLLGLEDVTLVQGALVASCLTQRLMELELDDEADKVPGGEGGVAGWEEPAPSPHCPSLPLQPGCQGEPILAFRATRAPLQTSHPRGSLYISGGPALSSSGLTHWGRRVRAEPFKGLAGCFRDSEVSVPGANASGGLVLPKGSQLSGRAIWAVRLAQ